MPARDSRPLYSTDGRVVTDRRPVRCSDCRRPLHACVCKDRATKHPVLGDGIVRVARERGGRGGQIVTLITGLPGDDAALAEVAARLKRLCGSGGTVKGRTVELQGDHREKAADALRILGHTVKLAGG
ncbi:MAG TPA: stress response translation initiation inhibitor YciH [Dehalococcoidia bacterium]|nr:stress response translation initiation inhibitor YciH [Dehalococcoidia bacterium]